MNNIPVSGHMVAMRTTNPLHDDGKAKPGRTEDDVTGSFQDVLMKTVEKVNNLQVDSENLTKQMIFEPESVDIHTVTIAAQKAEIALALTKTVRDEALRAYRELVNLR